MSTLALSPSKHRVKDYEVISWKHIYYIVRMSSSKNCSKSNLYLRVIFILRDFLLGLVAVYFEKCQISSSSITQTLPFRKGCSGIWRAGAFPRLNGYVLWYLALLDTTGLIFRQIQPRILPLPDLAHLEINYRRIPLLAIGRDVNLDSRLIIQTLEQEKGVLVGKSTAHQLSVSQQTAATPEQRILERLLHSFTMDTDFFQTCKGTPRQNARH